MGIKLIMPRETMKNEMNQKWKRVTKGMDLILPREKVTKEKNDSELLKYKVGTFVIKEMDNI